MGNKITVGTGMPDVDIQPGTYAAVVTGFKPVILPFEGQDNPCYEWSFEIDEVPITGVTSQTVTPKSKAYAWLVAMLGAEHIAAGKEFDESDLIGKPVLVDVDLNKNGWPRVAMVLAPPRKAAGNGGSRPQPVPVEAAPSPIRPSVRSQAGDVPDDLPF